MIQVEIEGEIAHAASAHPAPAAAAPRKLTKSGRAAKGEGWRPRRPASPQPPPQGLSAGSTAGTANGRLRWREGATRRLSARVWPESKEVELGGRLRGAAGIRGAPGATGGAGGLAPSRSGGSSGDHGTVHALSVSMSAASTCVRNTDRV